jgi:exonuclease SbcC
VSAHDRTLRTAAAEIADALDSETTELSPTGSLTTAVDGLTAWCDALVEAQHATADLDAAEARLTDLTAQALAAAGEQGFASLADIEAARLSQDELDLLVGRLARRADEEGRVRAVLDDPEIADVGAADDPADVTQLAALVARTEADAADTARQLTLHEDRASALGGLVERISTAVEAWAPVRDESLRAASISKLVRGMGHDNELQMRLSAYVLATRLDQVVDAANERLGHLRDQRYLLQRTGRAERRSAQAGLGLEIVDQWTGDVRAPSTLSGGETFVVSLSLALGLADVVTHESGGTEIETLFVDEGFGTLDADTLDDVMDRLDGLRAGGRTVGVVSHVTELRSRIPTQVHVDKGRSGSTVTVHTLVG